MTSTAIIKDWQNGKKKKKQTKKKVIIIYNPAPENHC